VRGVSSSENNAGFSFQFRHPFHDLPRYSLVYLFLGDSLLFLCPRRNPAPDELDSSLFFRLPYLVMTFRSFFPRLHFLFWTWLHLFVVLSGYFDFGHNHVQLPSFSLLFECFSRSGFFRLLFQFSGGLTSMSARISFSPPSSFCSSFSAWPSAILPTGDSPRAVSR